MDKSEKRNGLIKALVGVKDYITTNSQIEIIGNREIMIQGSKGIIEYTDELIRINLEDNEVQIYGQKLSISCLSQDSLEIKGIIHRLEYV